MEVYIVRHGQVPHNALKIYNSEDEDLNETGIKQAEDLRNKINEINYDLVIASPLIRARHTASIINAKNKEIIFDDRLKERNPGNLNGRPIGCINRDDYWNLNSENQYGTSENIKDFFKRVFSFLDELKEKEYNSVLIVAHGGVSKAFSGYFDGINDGKFLSRGLENCELKKYEF